MFYQFLFTHCQTGMIKDFSFNDTECVNLVHNLQKKRNFYIIQILLILISTCFLNFFSLTVTHG